MMRLEDIFDKTIIFAQMQTSVFRRDNSSGILAPMLKDGEAIEEHLVDVGIFICQEDS
jgi:hypothetical protein